MRQGNQNNRNNRQRGRGRRQNNGGGNPSNKVYDSNGPDVRVRGSAQTVADKYLQLAGDAQSQGDQIKTESYFQHAEHYLRIVAANNAVKEQKQAEKDKAAEEHTARMQAKKEKAVAELEKKSAVTGNAQGSVSDNAPESEADTETDDEWGGHQPAFLQREENGDAEKQKKPRRKPGKNKSSSKSADNGDDVTNVESTAPSDNEAGATSVG